MKQVEKRSDAPCAIPCQAGNTKVMCCEITELPSLPLAAACAGAHREGWKGSCSLWRVTGITLLQGGIGLHT